MDGPTPTTLAQRRSIAWILWSAVGSSVLVTIATVLWLGLPRWAPDLVIKHSPFVDPVLRAMGTKLRSGSIMYSANTEAFYDRVHDWDMAMVPGVMAALASSDPSSRLAALIAWSRLSSRSDNRPPPRLVDALCWQAHNDQEGENRALAIYGLSDVVSPQVRHVLLAGLRDPHALVREAAASVCRDKKQQGPDILAAVAGVLSDPAPTVRRLAADIVGVGRDVRAVDALIAVLVAELNMGAASSQVCALGWIGDRRAIEPLLQIINRPAMSIPQAALVAEALQSLEQIDKAQAIPLWITALTHAHPRVRFSAVMRFGSLREPSAVPGLVRLLDDPDALIRAETVRSLAGMNDPRTIDPILDAYGRGCCAQGVLSGAHLELGDLELPTFLVIKAIDGLPFTEEQRKRWEAMRDK